MSNLAWLNNSISDGVAKPYNAEVGVSRYVYVAYTAVAIDAMYRYAVNDPEKAYLLAVDENAVFAESNQTINADIPDTPGEQPIGSLVGATINRTPCGGCGGGRLL